MCMCMCVQVVACPFLRDKRTDNVTTVLQPCQVFFKWSEPLGSPPAMEVSIHALTLKVGRLTQLTHASVVLYLIQFN